MAKARASQMVQMADIARIAPDIQEQCTVPNASPTTGLELQATQVCVAGGAAASDAPVGGCARGGASPCWITPNHVRPSDAIQNAKRFLVRVPLGV